MLRIRYYVRIQDKASNILNSNFFIKIANIQLLFLGICYLIWSTHLVHIFQSAVRLIDDVGKVPKEKLCIQDVGMPDQYVIKFLGLCEQFFEIIIMVFIILFILVIV